MPPRDKFHSITQIGLTWMRLKQLSNQGKELHARCGQL